MSVIIIGGESRLCRGLEREERKDDDKEKGVRESHIVLRDWGNDASCGRTRTKFQGN